MTEIEIKRGTEEAARLLRENPSWPYKKVINKVKEMINHGLKTKDRSN